MTSPPRVRIEGFGTYPLTVLFSQELRDDVVAGEITVSFRLWKRPKVKPGGRYPVGPGLELIEVDSIELIPFADITDADVLRAGEPDRETLRRRAAHAGPIDDGTLLYRVEFHPVSESPDSGRAAAQARQMTQGDDSHIRR